MRVVNGFLKKYISVYVQAAAVYVKWFRQGKLLHVYLHHNSKSMYFKSNYKKERRLLITLFVQTFYNHVYYLW